jgi:hypothetical protein
MPKNACSQELQKMSELSSPPIILAVLGLNNACLPGTNFVYSIFTSGDKVATWSRSHKSSSSSSSSSPDVLNLDNCLTTLTFFWQLFYHFLSTFWHIFDNILTIFFTFFFISVVEASCGNKYYGSNFISAVPTSLLNAPGLRTIQFLFFTCNIHYIIAWYVQISWTPTYHITMPAARREVHLVWLYLSINGKVRDSSAISVILSFCQI